ncbi:MAG: signal peptidase I [Deltaproteobacteria bacterium]|nr:signal peptidase I [Deltaproteobacteria bacterium]
MWWMVIVTLLFPGFGQALVHRRVRAIAWAVAALIGVLGIIASVWLYPVTLVVHVAAAIDAALVLRRDARPGGLDRAAGALVVVLGAVGAGFSQLALQSFRVPSSSMYPTIEIGDHLFVDKLTPMWRPIARGELVIVKYPCDPRIPYIKRVIAVAGDTVEVRCDVIYVNGTAVPHTLVAKEWEYMDVDEASGQEMRQQVSRWHEELGGHGYDVYEQIGRGEPSRTGTAGERDFPRLDDPFPPGCADRAVFLPDAPRRHAVKGDIVDVNPAVTAMNADSSASGGGSGACALRRHYVVPKGALFTMGDNRYNANDSRFFGAVRNDDVIGRVIGVWWNASGVSRIGSLR